MSFLSYFILALMGVALFLLFSVLTSRGKRKSYAAENILKQFENEKNLMNERKKETKDQKVPLTFVDSILNYSSFTEKVAPANIIMEARRYEWFIGPKEYWTMYLMSGTGITISLYVMLNGSKFCLLGYVLAFWVFRFLLHMHRKKYKFVEIDRISIYMKTLSNSLQILGNVVDSVEEVKPLVHSSIKEELNKATIKLQQGKSVKESFMSLDKKYPYQELKFFHEMLDVADKNGGRNIEALESIAVDFEERKVKQMRLYAETIQGTKAFRNSALTVLAIPFIFKFFVPDAYGMLMSTPLGSIVFVSIACVVLYCYIRIQKLADWDPTQ
ncbi:TPA: type II secretion system F family protein [Bacillus paranthracis]|nr:type II secretion system F family protein [Bacillus paranthracis]